MVGIRFTADLLLSGSTKWWHVVDKETDNDYRFHVQLTGSNECRIQCFDSVGRHDNLNVATGIKSIKLVEKFQQGSLNLPLSTGMTLIPTEMSTAPSDKQAKYNSRPPFGPDGIYLVNENN